MANFDSLFTTIYVLFAQEIIILLPLFRKLYVRILLPYEIKLKKYVLENWWPYKYQFVNMALYIFTLIFS